MSCGEYGHYTDDANDAAGTAGDLVAKDVSGIYLISPDHQYDKPCNYLSDQFMKNMFKIPLTTQFTTIDVPNGCEFHWENNKVGIAFGGSNPYESMYHAEYIFNKLFQPGDPQVLGQSGRANQKPSMFGPVTEGRAAERPSTMQVEAGMTEESTLPNDTTTTEQSPTASPAATQFVLPPKTTANFVGIMGVGDKAVWEPGTQILRVLYLNHIISIKVQTPGNEKVRQQQAVNLANFITNELTHGDVWK
ncbi:hypothetical protein GCM10023189_28140 [Nibrella saemangeumensis]|uniref:Uncharacterized protein n=2 Tax=Nibrella saemangeumensis TaxID=1084526 RepID=A0ABP8MWT8_9BACT